MNTNSTETPKRSWRRRALGNTIVTLYCVAILLAFDFVYSYFFYQKDLLGRAWHEYYHHGLVANFEGVDAWGDARETITTNSLGFKDSRVRDVPAAPEGQRRIILIGDSFTEAVGMKFEDSFAGMLHRAGQERKEKIEFLNASALSYSPAIYYKRIKYLLEAGLRFDEVVVFSDISDVQDEATVYFCIDDNPDYRRYCPYPPVPLAAPSLLPAATGQAVRPSKRGFNDHFRVTSQTIALIRHLARVHTGQFKRKVLSSSDRRAAWTQPGLDVGNGYAPLGVEGGIKRSVANMQLLADLLRARGIGLSVVVYPWAFQINQNDPQTRQVQIWRDFCVTNCKRFIDLFPVLLAEKTARSDWFEHLFIPGDSHFSLAGHRIIFRAVNEQLQ